MKDTKGVLERFSNWWNSSKADYCGQGPNSEDVAEFLERDNAVDTGAKESMKIFELCLTAQGERVWISGHTVIEALKTYISVTGTDIVDLDNEDNITEVPSSVWSSMIVRNTEYDESDPSDFEEMTFDQWMRENTQSDIIAGTAY